MENKQTMIEVQNLCKSFHKLEVLKDISTTFYKNEVVSIIGPSGGGKSTFLRCLNLLEKPTSGHIVFDGVDICDRHQNKNIDLHRQKMGMVFQHFNLFPNMTVLQNIRCGIRSGSRAVPARKSAGKRGTRRENDRSVQHPRGQMPVLQVKVK